MKKGYHNKLLVAVDGSDRSIQTVEYLTDIPAFRTHEVNLLHVFNKVPESYYDLAKEPSSLNSISSVLAWEAQQREHMKKHMAQCRQLLMGADYLPDSLKTTIHNRQVGIARDIIAEARKGYDALVLRRRGMGRLHGLVMGSVAFKLLNGVSFVPLIFAGRKPFNHRVLIAVDGSEHAMRAVAFAAEKLKGGDCSIKLINVLRGDLVLRHLSGDQLEVQETFDQAEQYVSQSMEKARARLIRAGLSAENVTVEVVKNAASRAAAIVQAAADGNFSTIVMGRKGRSRVREFTIGRVSSKVLQVGKEFGLWIVQ